MHLYLNPLFSIKLCFQLVEKAITILCNNIYLRNLSINEDIISVPAKAKKCKIETIYVVIKA